jgi:hypothetical protein
MPLLASSKVMGEVPEGENKTPQKAVDAAVASPPVQPPPKEQRQMLKSIGGICSTLKWMAWDYFWGLFSLAAVGDAMREHSQALNAKRAKAFIALVVIFGCGIWIGHRFGIKETAVLRFQLGKEQEIERGLRLA